MWKHEQKSPITVSRSVVWSAWTAVERWPEWDTDLSESALLGEVAVGMEGRMKVADDALVSFTVSEVVPDEKFAYQTSLFGATLTTCYEMVEDESGLQIVHSASISGVLGFIWRLIIGKKVAATLDASFQNFIKHLEKVAAEEKAEPEQPAEPASAQDATANQEPKTDEHVSTEQPATPENKDSLSTPPALPDNSEGK